MSPRLRLAAFALCAACCGTDAADAADAAASASGNPRGKIGLECRDASQLDALAQAAIDQAARAILGSLRAGDTEALWAALHPQAQREDTKEAFVASMQAVHERLAQTDDEATREWAWQVDVRGGVNDLARIACGPVDAPTVTWMANVGGEDLALVSLVTTRAPFAYATTLQLRKRGDTWRLLGVQTNPSRYRDKSATDFEAIAAQYADKRQLVAAYLMLGIAQTLAERGAAVKTADKERLDDALARIGRTDGFVEDSAAWDIGGDRFDILGLSIVATRDDLAVLVKYVNDQGLVEDLLGRDADKLMDHVRTRFPELRDRFEGVVFEAYPQRPTDEGAPVQAYRTVRLFAAAPPTPSPAGAPSAPAAPASPPPTP